jgi:hypothetical protein
MSVLEVLLAVAGFGVTALVVAGMILITPRGQVAVHADGSDPENANLSPADVRSGPSLPRDHYAARIHPKRARR